MNKQIYAWTEEHSPLPAYVNLRGDGDKIILTVRQRGQQYGCEIEIPDDVANMIAFHLVQPTPRDELIAQTVKAPKTPRFVETYCSQCGNKFGPGDSGYSHCRDHRL